MLILKMALRNLRRHLRRTVITGLAISFGLALLIISSGFGDGAHGSMIESGVSAQGGHVVIQGKGWQQQRDNRIRVQHYPEKEKVLQQVLPGARILERIYVQGLLTSPNGSAGVSLTGIDPKKESHISDLHKKIIKGQYLDTDPRGIVMGYILAETLGVDLGDKVVLMVQRAGNIQSQLFRVQGLFKVGVDEIDGFFGQILLPSAQEVLGFKPDEVTQLAAFVTSYRQADEATAQVRAALHQPEIEILSWDEALPNLAMWINLDNAGLYLMILIIALVVLLGIVNTMLMSVLERTREFGVLLALGLSPRRLLALVMSEAALLGIFAVLLGLGLGLLGNWPGAHYGVDMSALMGGENVEAGGTVMASKFYADLSTTKVIFFCVLSYAMTLIAAIYPAVKAIQLKPVDSMRQY